MKISVELTSEKFKYSYKVGSSKQTGDLYLSAEHYLIFAKLLAACFNASACDHQKFSAHVSARAYIEKFPEEAQKYLDRLKEKEDG